MARHKNRVKTQRARKKAMTRNKNRVLEIENDGEYIDVQFVRNNGEVVIGIFKRVGWAEGLTRFNEAAAFTSRKCRKSNDHSRQGLRRFNEAAAFTPRK